MSLGFLTAFHTIISILALLAGIFSVRNLFDAGAGVWTIGFIVLAWVTTVTGFMFPFNGVTPAFALGIMAVIALVLMAVSQYLFHMHGAWAKVYSGGIVANLYFLFVALCGQSFAKIPALKVLAPTQSEPPFLIAQLVLLTFFGVLGFKAVRKGA